MLVPRMTRGSVPGATAVGTLGTLSEGALAAAASVATAPGVARRAAANADWNPDLLDRMSDWFVVDGVVHLSNTLPNNVRGKRNTGAIDFVYAFHEKTTPARYRIPQSQFARSWQPEQGVDIWFLESPTAVAVYHSTPLYDQYWDGLNSNEKGAYLKANYPQRVIWYGAVDLFEPLDRVKAKIDELASQGADGLKFYPTRTDAATLEPGAWFMNDRQRALPAFEHARDRGIRHIAVHKLLEYTGPETPALAIEDMYEAAAALPDVYFELVHAGWLLLEETAALMNKHENVVAVMEGPMLWLTYDLPAFHRMMAVFMNQVDVERMIYSSVATRQHPYWQLAGLLDYQPPEGANFSVSEQAKRKILGENAARLYGIDIPARRRALAADRFSRELALTGLREPYHALRA